MPSDPREIEAAVEAGNVTWERYPYYEWRYGERGRRYTASDSAWLATLSLLDQENVDQQVHWLGRVLAVRGMPRLLLRDHLRTLYQYLCAAAPEKKPLC